MVRTTTRAVGARAEQLACEFLTGQGLTPITRNFRCRLGEIDLVMRHGTCLVFVEVRFRSGRRLTGAGMTVDIHKQRKLIRTAALFLARHPTLASVPARFDVIAIDADERGQQTLDWIRDAFRPADASL